MRFWDTSAIAPLLVHESTSDDLRTLQKSDPNVTVSWTTPVECASAIARREHEGALEQEEATAAFARLDALAGVWTEVEPTNEIRDTARRLLRAYRLRASDAIQLASAIVAAERNPATLEFVTMDDRLETAALKEGFVVRFPGRESSTPAG